MLRMSFMEHLEELRSRIFKALTGVAAMFLLSLTFSGPLWSFICKPAIQALKTLGYEETLVMIEPMESFNIIWFKLPIVCAIFMGAPWIVYQVWAFISPGLYRREKRWAAPFILCSAGLFILGGVFAYFVIFRSGLTFLLSIGHGNYVKPMSSSGVATGFYTPEGTGFTFALRPGARIDDHLELTAGLHYEVFSPPASSESSTNGARFGLTADASWYFTPGLYAGIGAGYGGLLANGCRADGPLLLGQTPSRILLAWSVVE